MMREDVLMIDCLNRYTYELLTIMLNQWDLVYLDKHGQLIHDAVKKGLSDADAEARVFARKAFQPFREQFPTLADALLATLDSSKKKALLVRLLSPHENSFANQSRCFQGDMSNASSTHSLASAGGSRIRSANA